MFSLDEDDNVIFSTNDSIPQYHEPQGDSWWTTLNSDQMRTINDDSSIATSSNSHLGPGDPFNFAYITNPLTLTDSFGQYPFASTTRDLGSDSTTLGVSDPEETISPILLSNVPHDEYTPTPASREGVEPGLAQGGAFHRDMSHNSFMTLPSNDTSTSYAFPLGAIELARKRRRRHTIGQPLKLNRIVPDQSTSSEPYSANRITSIGGYTETEFASSPPIIPSSPPPHIWQTVSTPEDSTSSPYSASSAIDEQEPMSPMGSTQRPSWALEPLQLGLTPELRQHYDAFISLLSRQELSVEECQKALVPFSIIITEGNEGDGDILPPSAQIDEYIHDEVVDEGTRAAIPVDPIGDGGDEGGVESRKETGRRDPCKKKPRYVGRQCRLCHHMLFHQSQMHQHIMDHFGIYPFRCRKEGCSFSSTRKADLAKHVADQHDMKGVATCPHCHDSIKHKRNLPRHIKLKHRGPGIQIPASTSA